MGHFLRKCPMRKTCKKSFRSPKATIPKDLLPRLNESIAPRFEKSCSHLSPHKRPQEPSPLLYYEQSQQHRIIRAGAAVRLGWSPLAACPAIAYLSLQENYKLSALLCVIVYHYISS